MTDRVPSTFAHLEPLFDSFDGLGFQQEIMNRIDNLSADELAAISRAYSEIGRSNQVQQLTDWIHQVDLKDAKSRDKHLKHGAFVLLTVFDILGKKGVFPFSDGLVRYVRKFPARDWNRVPAEYHFLAGLADRYGIRLYEKGWDDTLASISSEVRAEMDWAGKELKASNRVLAVQDWMNAQPDSTVEVTALDGLLQLLNNFGML